MQQVQQVQQQPLLMTNSEVDAAGPPQQSTTLAPVQTSSPQQVQSVLVPKLAEKTPSPSHMAAKIQPAPHSAGAVTSVLSPSRTTSAEVEPDEGMVATKVAEG